MSEPAICAKMVVRYIFAQERIWGVVKGGERIEALCVGLKMTYLHRHSVVDEAVTVDRPSRGRVIAANDIAYNVWRLWLVLGGRESLSVNTLRRRGKGTLPIKLHRPFHARPGNARRNLSKVFAGPPVPVCSGRC